MSPAKAHPYDGVFVTGRSGTLRSSGEVVDGSDYAEIFRAGSTACSIPVLDIPELFESTSDGGRSSRPVDYSKIFGGSADSSDFGVPFEELLPPKPNNNTRTPADETRTRSRGRPRQLSVSVEKREPSRRPPEQQPLAGVKEFNVLYNRTNPESQYGESRTVPVAEVHAVNGYTRSVVNDARFDDNVGELPRIPKLSRRAVSGPQPRVAANEASQSYAEVRRRSGRSGSMSKDMFDVLEIGVGAQSSGVRSHSSTTSRACDSASASRSNMPENKPGNCSPSFSDEEVYANSVAAASAAAVRKAIEEAQARIKFAKELMERRKEGRVNFAGMNFGSGFKADKKVAKPVETLNSSRVKEPQEMNGKEQVSGFFARMSKHEQRQVSPDLRDKKEFSATQASGGFPLKKSSASLLDQSAEAYGNERMSTWGSRSDVAMKHDTLTVECVVTNSMKNVTPSTHENGFGKNMKTEEKSAKLTECLKETEVNEEDAEQGKDKSQIEVVPGTFQWSFDTNTFKSAQDLEHEEEHESEVRNVHDMGEADQALNVVDEHGQEQVQLESKQPEVEEGEDIKDTLECQGDNQDMPKKSEAISGVETTDHETEGWGHNLEDSGFVEVVLREGYEKGQDEIDLLNGKPGECESTECQENQEESSSPEVDEYRESNGHWEQDNEMKYIETWEENVVELRSNDLHGEDESNRREGEDVIRGHDKKETVTMGGQILHVDYQKHMTENQPESSSGTDRTHSQARLSTGDEEEMEVPQQTSMDKDGTNVGACAIYNQDEIEKFMETEEGGWYEETLEGVSVTAERMESPAYANGTEESDEEWEAGEDANGTVEDGFDAAPHPQAFIKLEHTMQGSENLETMNNTESAAETDFWSQQKQGEDHLRGFLDVDDQEPHVEEVVWESDESDVDIDGSEVGCNEEEYEGNTISGKMIESKATCVNPERTDEEVEETMMSSDVEENNVTDEDGIASIHGEEDHASQSSDEERQTNSHLHVETAEQSSSSEGVGRMTEVSLDTKFQCSEKIESRHKAEEKDMGSRSEVGIQNTRNLEKDELREKERQRIVVDRAIKEARERAFADARERAAADKAVAESRQRETAAASKKPEKAPSEANGKLAADRAAKDAKIKAERAAVERATAEARERALEKALAEKAAAVARNQAAKTAAEKFPSVSKEDWAKFRNNRSYDHQKNGNGTSSSLRQPSSSHHAAPNSAEKVGVSNYESGHWSKATVERHQRTAERAAKALAEKNMRDLLVQREQAERHRLAETLDADVKRWSNGKERSLRALLSTLQYILGPDSGWQPIPLTDLVSTAAVKKAYRKATLVVHPDKLQQRGASIQQKYICEKVFDLLKEAWNKFSAEER